MGLIIRITVILLTTMLSNATLAEVQIPHAFVSGAKAVASEVNENFTALKTAIDSKTRPIVKDGNGNIIGLLLGNDNTTWNLISVNGYLFDVAIASGEIKGYYASYDSNSNTYFNPSPQKVFLINNGYYYTPKGGLADPNNNNFSALDNDPSVTGVPNSSFQTPLTIEME